MTHAHAYDIASNPDTGLAELRVLVASILVGITVLGLGLDLLVLLSLVILLISLIIIG